MPQTFQSLDLRHVRNTIMQTSDFKVTETGLKFYSNMPETFQSLDYDMYAIV